jgi:hypothetical protein
MANLLFASRESDSLGLKTPEGVSLHAGWYNTSRVSGFMCVGGLSLLLKALDAWIAAQPAPKPSRPEAIRTLLAAAREAVLGVEQPTRALEDQVSATYLRRKTHRD